MIVFAFDDVAIARAAGADLAAGPVEKLGVVLEADRPSDLDGVLSFAGSIVRTDEGRWRLYYSCHSRQWRELGIAVAGSEDALHWTKPKRGSTRTSEVLCARTFVTLSASRWKATSWRSRFRFVAIRASACCDGKADAQPRRTNTTRSRCSSK